MELEKLAKSVEKAAEIWGKDHSFLWGPKSKRPKPEMVALAREDALLLRLVAKDIRKGDKKNAARVADSLDTIVRELIPKSVWDWLHPPEIREHTCPKCGARVKCT
jgi:hypothetical protein